MPLRPNQLAVIPVRGRDALVGAAPLLGAAPNPLGVPHVRQCQTNWCWAAVSTMVLRFRNVAGITQCGLANETLGASVDCCLAGASKGCDKTILFKITAGKPSMEALLVRHGQKPNVLKSLTMTQLQDQFTEKRPVGVCFDITGQGSHVILAVAMAPSAKPGGPPIVSVNDPQQPGTGTMTFDELKLANGHGEWVNTLVGL